jgi:AAA+ superfamily predicted ATPase
VVNELVQIGFDLIEQKKNKKNFAEEKYNKISIRVKQLMDEAAQKSEYLPFTQLSHLLQLSEYEKLLVCLLWYRKKECGSGVKYQEVDSILQPFAATKPQTLYAPCFHCEGDEISLSSTAYCFLENRFPSEPRNAHYLLPEKKVVYNGDKLLAPGRKLWQACEQGQMEDPVALVISGEAGSGRQYLAEQLAAEQNVVLLYITAANAEETIRNINEIILGTGLYGGMVCLDFREQLMPKLIQELARFLPFVMILKNASQKLTMDLGYTIVTQNLELPDFETRKVMIEELMADQKLPAGIKLDTIAAKWLPMGEFVRYCKSIRTELKLALFDSEQTIYQSDSEYLEFLPTTREFDELMLPPEQAEQLQKICGVIAAKERVMNQWGFQKRFSYGNGLSMLFYGAPGTGKTMAAQVMAKKLQMPLYRVDLSQLTSKYIGETQKNIGKIFKEASKTNCILLFDEADAVFARRAEVSDAQDRYSNGETAYLLQRMEQYSGVSILATNLLQNFDEAFRRRISYMVHFPMPDAQLREKIWATIIPPEAVVSDDVDYHALAHLFELSGSAIKNAVLQGACFAGISGTEIKMGHLLYGIQNEFAKYGKNLNEIQKEIVKSYVVT